jgi:Ca2+-binding EF-hand superfamily protein
MDIRESAYSKKHSSLSSARNAQSYRPASVQSEIVPLKVPHSRSTGYFKSDRAIDSINSNIAKIMLTCQARDQTSRGILSYLEFLEVLLSVDPNITEAQINRLISLTNCASGGKIRYKLFLEHLSKDKKSKITSQSSIVSDMTDNYNKVSLYPIAKLIWEKKLVITEMSQGSGMRPRLEMQPSELLSILKRSGVYINIHQLKAILREGEGSSVLELLQTVRKLSASKEELNQSIESARPYTGLVTDNFLDKIRNYLAGYNLSKFYQDASRGQELHVDNFVSYITEQSSGRIKALEAQKSFFRVSHDSETISETNFCKGFARYESPKQVIDRSLKKLRVWLRQDKLSTEQGFEYLLQISKSSQYITYDSWVKIMENFDFNLYESSILFDCIDTKQDKMIDIAEWINKVYEDEGPLQSFKDTVLRYKIDKEDLLIKLNAQSKQRLSIEDMAEALRRMDPTLTLTNAVNMARSAAGPKGYIDVQDFLVQLSQKPEDFQGNWKEQILRKIQSRVRGNAQNLRKILEEADHKNLGKLDLVKFQECIYKVDLGLDSIEIERLGRVLDRKNNLTVDYNEFLDHLEGPNLPPQDPLKVTAARLQMFLRQNDLSANQLLKKLGGGKVNISKFSKFLRKKVQKKFSNDLIDEIAEKFDVNKDGSIDIYDLMAILGSRSYLDISTGNTYPTRPISPHRAKVVIKDVRSALVAKKINYFDAFKMIDSDNLGVLSAKQFSDGLSKYIELSEPVKFGLFALIDKLGTGLITYESFLSVIKDNDLEPKLHKDTWNWENETIDKIRTWISKEGLTVENAFRAFDVDFDGVISKDDLKLGLMTVLKLQTKECPSSKMDRLYKLMDTFKRNSIQLSDFKLLFEENSNPEWKKGAKQQLGLYLSKHYPNIKTAFEDVSELTGKIKLEQFIKWVESNQILGGFNLTQQLLERLFADLDPHKKAYITEKDWENAFSRIDYKDQCIKEIKDAVRSNFSDIRSAFDHFASYHKPQPCISINFSDFQSGISSLIPKRFSDSEIESFWNKLWNEPQVDFSAFSRVFKDVKFLSTFNQTSKTSSHISTPMSYLSYSSNYSQDPLKRLQSLVKASPNNLEEVFKNIDTDDSGKLSAPEFRKALRKLSLGLSARDIDNVISRIDTNNDGQIDWQEFQKNFKVSETEKYTNGVAQNRIQKMRQNMYSYMLSPKDAFTQFDSERTGLLTFAKFNSLVNQLSNLSGESMPAFSVLKDLYDIIDIRKDGVIDMREWLNTFNGNTKSLEDSKEFDDISKCISRNRKLIQITFDAMSNNGRIDVQKAKEILGSVLRQSKVTDELLNKIISVAIKEGAVDYKLLLDIYKDRALKKQWHPRPT